MGDVPVPNDELLGGNGPGHLVRSNNGDGVGCLDVLDPFSFLRGTIGDAINGDGQSAVPPVSGESSLWMSGVSDNGGGFCGGSGNEPSALASRDSLDWGWANWTADGESAGNDGTHRWLVGNVAEGLGPGHTNLGDLGQPLSSAVTGGKRPRVDPLASAGSPSQWFLSGATAVTETMAGTVEAAVPQSQFPVIGKALINDNTEATLLSATSSATTGGAAASATASRTDIPRKEAMASASSAAGIVRARAGSALPGLAGWTADHTSSGISPVPIPTSVATRPPSCGRAGSPPASDSRFSNITGVSTGSDGSSDSHAPKGLTASPPHRRKYSFPAKRPRRALPPTSQQRARGKVTAPASALPRTPPPPLAIPLAAASARAQNLSQPLVRPLAAAAAVVSPDKSRLAPISVKEARPSGDRDLATAGSSGPPVPQLPVAGAPASAGGMVTAPREGTPPPLRALPMPAPAGTAALSSVFSMWFARSRAALRAATDGTASAATAAAAAAAVAAGSTPLPRPPAPCAQVSLALLATELTLYSNALSTLLPALVPWLPHPAVIEAYQMDATAHAASALGLVRLATVDAAGAFLAAHQLAVVVEAHAEKMSVHLLPLAGQAVGREALTSLAAAVAPPPSVAPPPIVSLTATGGIYPVVGPGAPNAPGSGAS